MEPTTLREPNEHVDRLAREFGIDRVGSQSSIWELTILFLLLLIPRLTLLVYLRNYLALTTICL